MKNKIIVFDFSDTLVKMRPAKLLVKKRLLSKLAEESRLGIITGAKKAETTNILKKLKICEYFDFIITKDDSLYKKPDKRLWKKIQRKFSQTNIIYIGDTQKDFLFAKKANIKFCYVGKRKYGLYQNKDINQIINFIVKKFLKC